MKVLVACEESQRVCTAFREKGHEAYSCDLQPCSGGYPEWHIEDDVLPLLNGDCGFFTSDGTWHYIDGRWDMIIAHPPCQFLSNAGNRHRNAPGRKEKCMQAADFFLAFVNADCDRVVIENPPGYMNSHYRKADQTIHPYYFLGKDGEQEAFMKRTCLWLRGVNPLSYDLALSKKPPLPVYVTVRADGSIKKRYTTEAMSARNQAERAKLRAKTAYGIAYAMADQWG